MPVVQSAFGNDDQTLGEVDMKPSPISELDHVDGPLDAAVSLIEYADFECPFCVKAYPVIESIRAAFLGKLCFVYRHVPKSTDKGFTKQAAEASEFAAAHGKFWAMHARLFLHPDQHDLESLVSAAGAIGLDPAECRTALVERKYAGRVRQITVRLSQERHYRHPDTVHQHGSLRRSCGNGLTQQCD